MAKKNDVFDKLRRAIINGFDVAKESETSSKFNKINKKLDKLENKIKHLEKKLNLRNKK